MRADIDSYREVADSLMRNKSRSILTGFGVFWGIFMLLCLIGGGAGLRTMLMENFEGFATNSAFLISSATTKPYKGMKEGRQWSLEERDIARLKVLVPELDIVSGTMARWGQTAERGLNTTNCNLKGVPANYSKIETPQIKYGRYLNESDCRQKRKVCVIGKRIYNNLFPEGGDPCGSVIKVGPLYCRVVGVDFNSGNISIQGRSDEAIVIPMQLEQQLFSYGNKYDVIALTCKDGVTFTGIESRIRQVLSRNHNFDPSDKQALFILNTEQMFSLIDNIFKGIDFLIWLVGLGTILAGIVGISNIMMVTVRERTVEIGIRRAIGATPNEILSQIIAESIMLTMIAGGAGIVLSVGILETLEKATGNPSFQISLAMALLAAVFLTVLGAVAGMPPAIRAMGIKPVDAMRDE